MRTDEQGRQASLLVVGGRLAFEAGHGASHLNWRDVRSGHASDHQALHRFDHRDLTGGAAQTGRT
ncbi:MAG TPA: hypothetical protein VK662_13510, partial [Acidothermaceae bacterium]|nr:hypothetical protein [Acidothermaceae bacterium]